MDPTGSTADGRDDDNASAFVCVIIGGERVRGDTGVPGSRSSHGTPGPSPRGQRAHSSTPARAHSGDLAGKYGVQASAKDFEATLLDPTPHRAILTRSRYQRIDHLGLSQNARWNDPILATSVKTPG